MTNGTKTWVMTNMRFEKDAEQCARWTANLMSTLRPGGTWIVPKSISTVLVLCIDPKIAQVHSIFPNPRLADALIRAGWVVQHRDPVAHS